jgi:hypothetical protein
LGLNYGGDLRHHFALDFEQQFFSRLQLLEQLGQVDTGFFCGHMLHGFNAIHFPAGKQALFP